MELRFRGRTPPSGPKMPGRARLPGIVRRLIGRIISGRPARNEATHPLTRPRLTARVRKNKGTTGVADSVGEPNAVAPRSFGPAPSVPFRTDPLKDSARSRTTHAQTGLPLRATMAPCPAITAKSSGPRPKTSKRTIWPSQSASSWCSSSPPWSFSAPWPIDRAAHGRGAFARPNPPGAHPRRIPGRFTRLEQPSRTEPSRFRQKILGGAGRNWPFIVAIASQL